MHYPNPSKVVQRRGFTALELIIVLVVGFSIIAMSASKMGDLFSSSSTVAAMNSILELYSSTRMLRGPNGYGTAENLLVPLKQADMLPKGLTYAGDAGSTTASNEWGGPVTLVKSPATDVIGFTIEYNKVPAKSCLQLAQNLYSSGNFSEILVHTVKIEETTDAGAILAACKEKPEGAKITLKVTG